MCGIIGFTFPPEGASSLLSEAVAALRHRGPDGAGELVRDGVALGHARLSIIDLEGGAQPMESADTRYAITYNGELYNFIELRDDLEKRGHQFRTHSDTEVILTAYQEWGVRCVERFRGMFAFAISDYAERKLFIARDHIGIKPLLYANSGKRFSFASEFKSLLTLPWVAEEKSLNQEALALYLRFGYIPDSSCGFSNIHKLAPAHRLLIDIDEPSAATPERYWQMEIEPDRTKSAEEWQEEIEQALKDSVKAHLVADVPFGAFLSGGLDSTLVVQEMAEILDRPVKTFSIGFEEAEFDERVYAREAAKVLGSEHHEEVVSSDALTLLPTLVDHYGEPFGDSSAIPTWHVSRLAREHVPMALSGDGGDEFFAGYHSYCGFLSEMQPWRPERSEWKRILRPFLQKVSPSRFPDDPAPPDPDVESFIKWHVSSHDHADGLWREEMRGRFPTIPKSVHEAFARVGERDPVSRARMVDIHHYLPADILTKVDIASMMHGLESRTPLADVRIAELAGRIPSELLITSRGKKTDRRSWEGKQPFRKILRQRFSDEFVNRPKMGFGIPLPQWLFGTPGRRDEVYDRLLGPDSRILQFLDREAVSKILVNRYVYPTWHLLFLEEWMRQHRF